MRKRKIMFWLLPTLIVVLFLLFLSVFNLLPILWMVFTSLKIPSDVYHVPIKFLPTRFSLWNYRTVLFGSEFSGTTMPKYLFNSLVISSSTVLLSVIMGLLAGYSFTRYSFPGKDKMLSYILYTTALPRVIIILPLYILMVKARLQGTYLGLVFVYLVVTLPISVWFFISFFRTIPRELDEAARIDGCTTLQLLWKVVVPLVRPGIFATVMYSFVQAWNEYLLALVFSSSRTAPATVGLVGYLGETGVHWGPLMAASCIMTVPTVFLFTAFGKYLAKGLVAGAVKG
jgi:ABC-type glycerol-3-phosphate transport system permease component